MLLWYFLETGTAGMARGRKARQKKRRQELHADEAAQRDTGTLVKIGFDGELKS